MGTFRAVRWGNDSLSSEKILFSIWENVGIENSPCLKFWTYLDQISSVPNNSWFQGCYFHLRCHHHRHCRQGCLSWVWQRGAIAWSEISSAAKIWDELARTQHIWHLSGADYHGHVLYIEWGRWQVHWKSMWYKSPSTDQLGHDDVADVDEYCLNY